MPITPRWTRWLLAGSLFAAGCGAGPNPAADPDGGSRALAIVGAQLVDGTGADPVPDAVVVIRGGRIAAAGSRAGTAIPAGAEIVDAAGRTVMPGLVETHAHYNGEPERVPRQYRSQLYFGVTTSRSIGSDPPGKVALALDARAGRIPGPRLYTAGLGFSHPDNGFPPGRPINRPATAAEARELVRGLAGQGAHFVKMWVDVAPPAAPAAITPEMRAAIVEEARAHGLTPVAHVGFEADFFQLAGLGVSDFLHTVRDAEPSEAFYRRCREIGCVFSPTLTNVHAGWYWAEQPERLDDPEIRAAFEPEALARWSDPAVRDEVLHDPRLAGRKARLENAMAWVKQVADAGVPVAVGTDSGASSFNVPMGWGTHHELALYVDAGLTPMQALVAATRTEAELLSGGPAEYGTLEPGKMADLLLLAADPLADVRNTRAIERVMQAGVWLDRAALMPLPE